jgi:hypothetical protein
VERALLIVISHVFHAREFSAGHDGEAP